MNKIQLEKFIYNKPVETNQERILEKLHCQYIRNKEMNNFLIEYFNSINETTEIENK